MFKIENDYPLPERRYSKNFHLAGEVVEKLEVDQTAILYGEHRDVPCSVYHNAATRIDRKITYRAIKNKHGKKTIAIRRIY